MLQNIFAKNIEELERLSASEIQAVSQSLEQGREILIKFCAPIFGLFGVFIVVFSQLNGLYDYPITPIVCGFAAGCLLLAPFILNITQSTSSVGLLLTTSITLGMLSDAWSSGGIASPVIPVLAQMPLLAVFFIGPRAGISYAVFVTALLALLTFAAPYALDVVPSSVVTLSVAGDEEYRALFFASISTWACLLLVLSCIYVVMRAAKSIIESRNEFEKASISLSGLVSALSHDLRTPLNAIIGFADMAKQETAHSFDREKITDYASVIHDSGKLILDMMSDLLLYAKLSDAEGPIETELVDLYDLVETQIRQLELKLLERDQEIKLTARDLPIGDVECNFSQVARVIANIISNGIKYSPEGSTISASVTEHGSQEMCISVSDRGRGMSHDEIKMALQPFSQIHGDTRQDVVEAGVGLGLSICQRIVEGHHGKLEIDSARNVGTTVRIILPKRQFKPDIEQSMPLVA